MAAAVIMMPVVTGRLTERDRQRPKLPLSKGEVRLTSNPCYSLVQGPVSWRPTTVK